MSKPKIRCAIYTRKSTEEGLEQEFNSLDAQYEACAAYITSQRHEGWTLVNKRYDDGGVSGGTLQRPGLQALLADIEAGLVDRIIVYKIDRLTRSLGDFSKIVDRLDAMNASFVSVTQSFNTATSMGRLTLNMLLSFAQFEREVTAERIRDKIAASKAKGLWMGGCVPLGYDTHPDKNIRGLVINKAEASTVVDVFKSYLQLGCLAKVERSLAVKGLRGKPRRDADTGAVLSRGAIHKILTNPIYKGKIKHKDKLYDGQHASLIEGPLWEDVQIALQSRSARRRGGQNTAASQAVPLKGKLFDASGKSLTPTHTKKNGRVIRYYVSNRLIKDKDPNGWRLPAKQIEPVIADLIFQHLSHRASQGTLIDKADVALATKVQAAVQKLGAELSGKNSRSMVDLLAALQTADIEAGSIKIKLHPMQVAALFNMPELSLANRSLAFSAPFDIRKRGVEAKLITGQYKSEPDTALICALAKAHIWVDQLKSGTPMLQIAKDANTHDSVLRTRIRLAFLSPKIQSAILAGTQPADLTLAQLKRIKLSNIWAEQEAQLGVN